jgi:Na+/H+ antiporter NhaC
MDRMGNASGGEKSSNNSDMFTSNRRYVFVSLLISFATFNIRGLGSQQDNTALSKRELLGLDCVRYNVDICALQETKVVEPGTCTFSNGFKLTGGAFGQPLAVLGKGS